MDLTPSLPPDQLERIRPVIEQLHESFRALAAGLADDIPSAVDLDLSRDEAENAG